MKKQLHTIIQKQAGYQRDIIDKQRLFQSLFLSIMIFNTTHCMHNNSLSWCPNNKILYWEKSQEDGEMMSHWLESKNSNALPLITKKLSKNTPHTFSENITILQAEQKGRCHNYAFAQITEKSNPAIFALQFH